MNLSRMWDIGGCRVILNSVEEVYLFSEEIKKHLDIRKDDYDYIKNPQPDGYKSYHLFVNSPIDNKVIEIQLRCQDQHNWATLVEISDLVYDSKLKEYGKDKRLLRFHYLLSKNNLSINENKEIANTIKEYNYIEKLNSIFNRNYLSVRLQWLLIENEYRHTFFLIETQKNSIPNIEAFDDFKKAESEYFKKFNENDNANVVLTYLLKPRYEQISVAYSNYMLTMHACLNDFTSIFENLIIDSLKEKNYYDYLKYLSQFQEISIRKYANFTKESNLSKNIKDKMFNKMDVRLARKMTKKISIKNKEWEKSIKEEIKLSSKKLKQFAFLIEKNKPNNKLSSTIFRQITNYTTRKYTRKYRKLLKEV